MSTSISGLGSNAMMMQGMGGMRRPDSGKMAEDLFSKLDSSGQGYITESDLQGAFDKVSSSSSSSTSSNASELFSKLDSDSDGKVTKDEFSSGLKQVAEELDSQFMSMRMNGGMQAGGMGGMPPPPEGDSGFTKDELTAQLDEIGSSDSQRSSLISNIVNNFDEADSDGDGKVSFQEAMAYDQSTSSTNSTSSSSTSTDTTGSTSSTDTSAKLAMQIMQLMEAYGLGGNQNGSDLTSLLSITA